MFSPGSQYYHSTLSSTGHSKAFTRQKPYREHLMNNIVKITSSTLRKYLIIPIKGTEPHVTKTQYEGSETSHTERSHGRKYIKVY